MNRVKTVGVWGSPSESGKDRDSIRRYLDKFVETGINALFMHLKGGDGYVYWPSERFRDCIAPGFENIDYPATLLEECRQRGIRVDAWIIDFFEGENGAAYKKHPEWAMRNPHGQPTNSEILRGERFTGLWMCPAQRPGYADSWLVPIYKEFAERYDFDGIHHDYVRYPGDMAPDQYCFCDYCLENIPRFNGYVNAAYPEEPFYHELYDRGYLEAHWEQSPRVLPRNWDSLDRVSKSRFLLEGGFFQGGRNDLDYFFYSYRMHWITEFTRLAAEAVRNARPGMKISAAIFKNPIHSGRFIGQDWRTFAPFVDTCIPMDYRDHFPGTFDQYLDLLAEAIRNQKVCAAGYKELFIGSAINFLFKEEPNGPYPEYKLQRLVERISGEGVDGMVFFCDEQLRRYGMYETLRDVLRS